MSLLVDGSAIREQGLERSEAGSIAACAGSVCRFAEGGMRGRVARLSRTEQEIPDLGRKGIGRNASEATIIDVARRANVSKSLVSLVMRGSPYVSEARRSAVLKAAAELDYRPNALARGLRAERTQTVGVLLPVLDNPFLAELVEDLQAELASSGYQAILGTEYCIAEREAQAIAAMLDRRVDGLILIGTVISQSRIRELAERVPVVLVGRRSDDPAVDFVMDDGAAGAALAVEHLVRLGHRRIAHISGELATGPSRAPTQTDSVRCEGYKDAMRRMGLAEHIRVVPGPYTEDGGYRAARVLLSDRPRPTAIFAGCDMAAIGALSAIEEEGLTVPGDISLVGYDNSHLAALGRISLTSISQPGEEIGRLAARFVRERAENERTEPAHVVVAPELVPRSTSSTAPAE
jgi:DNA-binding LacI/PurR family transcriptional regulator